MENSGFLNIKELAAGLGRSRAYVSAMKYAGFPLIAGRNTLFAAHTWLEQHPDFRIEKKQGSRHKRHETLLTRKKVITDEYRKAFYEALPEAGKETADIIGIDGLVKLVSAAKGNFVSIPLILENDSAIVRLIGMEMARQLALHYKGEVIPTNKNWLNVRTKKWLETVRHALACGLTFHEIAELTGTDQRGLRAFIRHADRRGGGKGSFGPGSSGGGSEAQDFSS